jgi:xanthine dehydrogenase YagR molybdenum-binding subunit
VSTDAPFRIVGQRAPRPDAQDKVFGLTRYADDFAMGGMLHAKVVRTPLASARILGIDPRAAGPPWSSGPVRR